ncbi:hypothetical protein BN1723_020172, partial [Verticillium longisporum]
SARLRRRASLRLVLSDRRDILSPRNPSRLLRRLVYLRLQRPAHRPADPLLRTHGPRHSRPLVCRRHPARRGPREA